MLDDIQKHIDKVTKDFNNRSLPEFEGYSPAEMHHILHFLFQENCPLQIKDLPDADYEKIPLLNQVKYLMDLLYDAVDIKLTNKGYLPTKIVADIYAQGYMSDEFIDKGISKLYKETDSMAIHLTHLLLVLSGLAKKRKGMLSLTQKGIKTMGNDHKLLRLIFTIFATRFNWAYFDRYGYEHIGQLGFGFSLILLKKYGSKRRLDRYYADKYFNAFPMLTETEPTNLYIPEEELRTSCYSHRTFERFLDYFGLVKLTKEGEKFNPDTYVEKLPVFDKFIKVLPHNPH